MEPPRNSRRSLIGPKRPAKRFARQKNLTSERRFVAYLAHEIRTPLNGLLGLASLLGSTKLSLEQSQYVGQLQAAGDHLLQLLNTILDSSKAAAGAFSLEAVTFSPSQVLQEVAGLFSGLAKNKGITCVCEIDSTLPPLLVGDVLKLRQILSNLVSNAIKFTNAGRVTLFARKMRAGHVGFAVSDTGPGIPRSTLKGLFREFSQGSAAVARTHGGTGLGLALCKNFVVLMGGELSVDSTEGKGTTFSFYIPMAVAPLPANQRESTATVRVPALPQRVQPKRILVAEDNVLNQRVISEMIRKCGHRPDIVGNGHDALQALNEQRYDLVLMDCSMPKMNGYETTKRIRQLAGETCRIPIIALTGLTEDEERQRCLDAGMDDYLAKPVKLHEVADRLQRWFESRR